MTAEIKNDTNNNDTPADPSGLITSSEPITQPELITGSGPTTGHSQPETSVLEESAGRPSCEAPEEPRVRPTWPLPPPGQRSRVGKVAKLPPDILEWVNLQLLDEVPYAAILDELDDRGYCDISQQNLTNWKTCGGYNQWLSGHIVRQQRRSELETVCSLVSQSRGRLDEAALFLISSQLLSVVGDFDLSSFKTHLAKDPQGYLRVIQALTRLNKARQGSKKITQTSLVNKPSGGTNDFDILPETERGLTEETLKKITDAIRLF
ncbi:MAG: hypothetical protein JWM16_1866 [Verrucomicrobiales bacterium]|nr:hypothetical protein [Verrucomicrobiales bacterium]